jgi:hypothetical protein
MPDAKKKKPRTQPVSYFPLPVRMLLLAMVAVGGSAYALIRHYTHPHVPMYVTVRPDAGASFDPEAGELPAPEIELLPASR